MSRRAVAPLALALVLLLAGVAGAQPRKGNFMKPESPEPPVVWLYSFGLGEVVFEKFGHSAMCLEYTATRRPIFVCFNYGVTDFSNPGKLGWDFARANAIFWVEPVPEPEILRFYTQYEHRDVFRQRLPLTPDEARSIEHKLWDDLKEENRYYRYHHFFNNCTTRLRDMIDVATGGRLSAPTKVKRHPLSFRQFGARGLNEFEVVIAVSDFITGRTLDYHPTMWEAMFHPDELRLAVEEHLGAPTEVLYDREAEGYAGFRETGPSGRGWVLLIHVLLVLPLVLVRWLGKREGVATVVACLPLFVWGIAVWAILAIIRIDWVQWNEAVMIFVPTDLAIPFLAPARRQRYAQVRLGMVALATLLAAVGVFRQPLWLPAVCAFLPLALLAFDVPRRRAAATHADKLAATGST